jgi:mannonate dehydratase
MPEISLVQPNEEAPRWHLARQTGVTSAVGTLPDVDDHEPWSFEALLELDSRFEEAGLSLDVIESRPPVDDAILGREGRDEQIEVVKQMLRNMGRVGIDVWCYVWMAPLKVLRTAESVRGRGDSLVTAYDHDRMEAGPEIDEGVSEAELWENLEYFLEEVVPVAEEADVKLALHPDDPPTGPVRGVDRIVTSVENFQRVLDLHDSRYNGITFCQGNFSAMEADIPAAIRQFGDRIHFAHFRDVEGGERDFTEVWHDEGPTDMLEAMRAYVDVGFEGPMRPDHVPDMYGEERGNPGYQTKGRLWAVGYMRGLIEAARSQASA